MPLALKNSHVSPAKAGIAQSVTHGINSAVNIAKVVKKVPQPVRYARCAGCQRLHENENIVRGPSKYEGRKNR